MVFFAYDGSINGDWVSHYAVQIAAAQDRPTLALLHVRTGHIAEPLLDEKLQRLRAECTQRGVRLVEHLLAPIGGSVLAAIRAAVPIGPEHFLICGTRARARGGRFLRGTLGERFLRADHCNVLIVRVLQPGVLGSPRRLLLPLREHPHALRSALPVLRLFEPQITQLHLVLVARVGHRRFSALSHARAEELRAPGLAYCTQVEQALVGALGLGATLMDAHVVVSDRIPHEILIAAQRTKSRLICMEASRRHGAMRLIAGDPVEQVLREATCDVLVYRGLV